MIFVPAEITATQSTTKMTIIIMIMTISQLLLQYFYITPFKVI